MSEKFKSIQIRLETYEQLSKMGNLTDSFDSVISSLLKKSRPLQSDSRTDCDLTTSTMNQLTERKDHNYG